jgi:AcrR family transcriptional regulator
LASREKIISAAIEVFSEKGEHGARMEEIAARAKINKAMLYYFFNSKGNLYKEVLAFVVKKIFKQIQDGLQTLGIDTLEPGEGVKAVVQKHFEVYRENIQETIVLMEGFVHSPENVKKAMENLQSEGCVMKPGRMMEFFENGVAKHVFRPIDTRQVFISIMGMNLIYYMARPIAQMVLGLDVKDEQQFLQDRQASIVDVLLNGILEKGALGHA